MTFNALEAQFASFLQIDKIIGTYTGSFVSTAPTSVGGSTTVSEPITTNITIPTFFQGIYSIDNGTTWNDFCNKQYILPPGIFFPFFTVTGKSTANTMTITAVNFYNYNTSTGTAYTVLYKVALIAQPNQGIITPQPIGTDIFFDSRENYQKILLDDETPVSIGSLGSASYTIPHNLEYIPKVRLFIFNNADSSMSELDQADAVSLSTTDVFVTYNAPLGGIVGTLYTRVYYD